MPKSNPPSATPPLIDALEQTHLQPLWDRYMRMLTMEPQAPDEPMLWSWEALQPLIERARREVPMEHAERRVLLLSNPAFAPKPYTTTNLQAGLQILEPGDTAPVHRHAAAALRFVMQGSDTTTFVNGKACPMKPGDLILTPSWCWHEHRNEGNSSMVWFDGLDLPLVHTLASAFLQFGPMIDAPAQVPDHVYEAGMAVPNREQASLGYSPRFHYAGSSVSAALDALPAAADGSRLLRYTNPLNGEAVMPTLDCYAQTLTAHAQTRAWRSTSNTIAVVVEGEGVSTIGDETLHWQANDVFTIPHWKWVSHCSSSSRAQLFLMTDRGLLDKMGYLRTEYEA